MRKNIIKVIAFMLMLCMVLPMAACGSERGGYRIVDTYSGDGNFCIAFRKDDLLCDIISAALKELAALSLKTLPQSFKEKE